MISVNKLTNRGFSHLLVPVLAFLMVAGLGGAYFLATSHAATPASTTTSTTSSTTASTGEFETITNPEPAAGTSSPDTSQTYIDNANKLLAAQTSSGSWRKICLNYGGHQCLKTHGVGAQLTIQGTGTTPTGWHFVGFGNQGHIGMQDESGDCLRANSDDTVTIESGSCSGNQDGEMWYLGSQHCSALCFKSVKFGGHYLAATNDSAGKNVWASQWRNGLWVNWNDPFK